MIDPGRGLWRGVIRHIRVEIARLAPGEGSGGCKRGRVGTGARIWVKRGTRVLIVRIWIRKRLRHAPSVCSRRRRDRPLHRRPSASGCAGELLLDAGKCGAYGRDIAGALRVLIWPGSRITLDQRRKARHDAEAKMCESQKRCAPRMLQREGEGSLRQTVARGLRIERVRRRGSGRTAL